MSEQQGVIHDIGYRHYEGPRLGRFAISRALALQSLRNAYGLGRSGRSKVMPLVLLAVMVVPAAISVGIMNAMRLEDPPIAPATYAQLLQPAIALYLASQAPQLFSRDLRYSSIVLYLARPPRRFDYALAKLVALTGALMVFLGLPLVVLYAGALLAKQGFTDATQDLGVGLGAALILSVLLAAIGGLIAAATPRRGFASAAIIALMLVTFTAVVVTVGILGEQDRADSRAAHLAELGSPFTLAGVVQTFLLREGPDGAWMPTVPEGLAFVAAYLLIIACCLAGLARRYATVARG